jgi:hypothetical protein
MIDTIEIQCNHCREGYSFGPRTTWDILRQGGWLIDFRSVKDDWLSQKRPSIFAQRDLLLCPKCLDIAGGLR